MFITLFFAIIDTKSKKLTYSRAGHEPAILLKASSNGKSSSVEKLHGSGMAVGMVPSEIFDEMIEDNETVFESEIVYFCTQMEFLKLLIMTEKNLVYKISRPLFPFQFKAISKVLIEN